MAVLLSLSVGVIWFVLNRWRYQGPVLLVLMQDHGVHLSDLVMLVVALPCWLCLGRLVVWPWIQRLYSDRPTGQSKQ